MVKLVSDNIVNNKAFVLLCNMQVYLCSKNECVLNSLLLFFQVKNIKHNGNITLDQVIDITRIMRPRSLAVKFAGTMCEILGSAQVRYWKANRDLYYILGN